MMYWAASFMVRMHSLGLFIDPPVGRFICRQTPGSFMQLHIQVLPDWHALACVRQAYLI
jgi:hypothetical protein